jgi:hypothetical protein
MKDALSDQSSAFDGPATYRIEVQGRIPPKWCDRLEGMAVTLWTSEAGTHRTWLQGELLDQASLAGVLATLCELHVTVLFVDRIS